MKYIYEDGNNTITAAHVAAKFLFVWYLVLGPIMFAGTFLVTGLDSAKVSHVATYYPMPSLIDKNVLLTLFFAYVVRSALGIFGAYLIKTATFPPKTTLEGLDAKKIITGLVLIFGGIFVGLF
ncbi:MAG: hypothetical protein WCX17_01920 [Parcubacteria group bacterium]